MYSAAALPSFDERRDDVRARGRRRATAANGAFTDATVEAISGQLAELGDVDSVTYVRVAPEGGNTIYTYIVTCGKAKIAMTLGLDAANKISAIGFESAEPATTS